MQPGQIIFEGKIKNGLPIVLRYPEANDLKDLLNYINTLSKERTYISFQGQQLTVDEEKKYLDNVLNKMNKNEDIHILAYSQKALIGIANITLRERVETHVGDFGISVAKQFRNQGIGKLLTEKILEEAGKNLFNLKIVTLVVYANNNIAIEMYKNFGFKKYGVLPKGIVHRDKFIDQILMYQNLTF
ncbi:GNAT family N-acetyltransferase [Candidatus Curtissbacteria bacterium]|nr:GNAT family N-acetyltransferase [Candidatus Curtissbacteria bacterium]